MKPMLEVLQKDDTLKLLSLSTVSNISRSRRSQTKQNLVCTENIELELREYEIMGPTPKLANMHIFQLSSNRHGYHLR